MFGLIVSALIGALCIALGRMVINGNISLLHSYHTLRVTEEDMPHFCKSMGLGLVILGCGIVAFGVIGVLALCLPYLLFTVLAFVCLAASLLVGLTLCLYALIKYNKGIF